MMRLFDFKSLLDGINDDVHRKFFINDDGELITKEEMMRELEELETRFHSRYPEYDSYNAFVDGIDLYLTLFPLSKEAEPYREKSYRIIDEVKNGSTSMDKLEDLVKIFISIMRCCSDWVMGDHNSLERPIADTDFEFAIDPSDFELHGVFGELDIMTEIPHKGFLWTKKRELFDKDHQEFITAITTYLMFRLLQFEGYFTEEETAYE